jgi:hypothetical protein
VGTSNAIAQWFPLKDLNVAKFVVGLVYKISVTSSPKFMIYSPFMVLDIVSLLVVCHILQLILMFLDTVEKKKQ